MTKKKNQNAENTKEVSVEYYQLEQALDIPKSWQKYPNKPSSLLEIKPRLAEFKYWNIMIQPEVWHMCIVTKKPKQ